MTYGWAILIIVIVAVILYSMGIFSPSSSITTSSSGFSPFIVSSAVCSQAGLSIAVTAGGLPNNAVSATLSRIFIQSNTGTTAMTGKEYNITPVTLASGHSTVITVPGVACISTGIKFSLSSKLQYSYSTAVGNVAANATGTIAGTTSSPSITNYVPLTITSSTATPSPFQQMIIVNMNTYSSYASSNLENIEFTYPNGTIIPSWRENGTSNAQTVVYWLKLGSFTSLTVHMDFFPTGDNVLNPVNTGEAPQLSGTYAQYDNGVNVFNYYTNFAGTSLPSGWTYISQGGSTYSVNNGITFNTVNSNPSGGIFSSVLISSPIVIDAMQSLGNNAEEWVGAELNSFAFAGATASSIPGAPGWGIGVVSGSNPGDITSWSATSAVNPPAPSTSYVITGYYVSGSLNVLINYTSKTTTSSTFSGSNSLAIWTYSITTNTVFTQWLRTREYPPNGVMPSIAFGSIS